MQRIRQSLRKVSFKVLKKIRVDALDGAIIVIALSSEGASMFWQDEDGAEMAHKIFWGASVVEFLKRVAEKLDDMVNGKISDRTRQEEPDLESAAHSDVEQAVQGDEFQQWARTGFDLFNE